jgi:hypothetical protein
MEPILTNLANCYPNVSRVTSANKILRKSENVGTPFMIELTGFRGTFSLVMIGGGLWVRSDRNYPLS